MSRRLRISANLVVLCFAGWLTSAGPVRADLVAERLDNIERRLARVEQAVELPATPPTTRPVEPDAAPVRADTFAEMRAAILSGARWIQTSGIEMTGDLDARGATIELLPGGPGWKPALSLAGDALLANATIKVPPSSYNEKGQRTGFFKAITASGRNMTLRNVVFAPDGGFCIHLFKGKLKLEAVKASTFSEYFMFQEPGTFAEARWIEVKGGSKAESVWRVNGANYHIEESLIDNSAGGKSALRGDSPGIDGSPGGIVRRTRFVGQIGPNPLTEDDGGQMLGIDRWRFAEGWIYQLDYSRKAETIAFARQMYLAGASAPEIVRACADKFIDAAQLAKAAKGKTRLTDNDIKLTLDLRAKEVGRRSTVLIEHCEVIGDLRLNARVTGTIRNTRIQSTGDNTPLSGNSQPTYPFPIDRVIVGGEQAPAPDVTFDGVEFVGGPALGIDPAAWPSIRFINNTTYRGNALGAANSRPVFNSTPIEIDGFVRIRTDGGLTYRDAMGQLVSAWIGGYDGPGGTGPRPADWSRRWREYDETKLRAYARALKGPIFILNIEHWELDPDKHGEATARQWLGRMARMCQIIKQERPDLVVGVYDILPVSVYWPLANMAAWERWKATGEKNNSLPDAWWAAKEAEYASAIATWKRQNEFVAAELLPHVDALFPSIYPNYRMTGTAPAATAIRQSTPTIRGSLTMDADVTRMRIEEAVRIAQGKPVYPFYWPVITEDGGEIVDEGRTANIVKAALDAGAAGVVLWSDQRPRDLLERTATTIRQTEQKHRKNAAPKGN